MYVQCQPPAEMHDEVALLYIISSLAKLVKIYYNQRVSIDVDKKLQTLDDDLETLELLDG